MPPVESIDVTGTANHAAATVKGKVFNFVNEI